MITPYMEHDLAGLLENKDVVFSDGLIKCYLLQLLDGTKYLHDSHILHRDMKGRAHQTLLPIVFPSLTCVAANLLIDNRGVLRIADFGLARTFDEPIPVAGGGGGQAQRDYTNCVVTRWYRPPELLLGEKRYTSAIDLWGVGYVSSRTRVLFSPLIDIIDASLPRCTRGSRFFRETVTWIRCTKSLAFVVRLLRNPCLAPNDCRGSK